MPGLPPKLDPALCRTRQEKLRHYLAAKDLDGAVFFNRHYITSFFNYADCTLISLLILTDITKFFFGKIETAVTKS